MMSMSLRMSTCDLLCHRTYPVSVCVLLTLCAGQKVRGGVGRGAIVFWPWSQARIDLGAPRAGPWLRVCYFQVYCVPHPVLLAINRATEEEGALWPKLTVVQKQASKGSARKQNKSCSNLCSLQILIGILQTKSVENQTEKKTSYWFSPCGQKHLTVLRSAGCVNSQHVHNCFMRHVI